MGSIPQVRLNSGSSMPVIGLGTACLPYPGLDKRAAILQAIQIGYRHFDSATIYQSEVPLGEAIGEALQRRLIQSRKEIFIASKVWCNDAHPDLVLPTLQKTLKNLQLEYIDLYLIHWPVSAKPGECKVPPNPEELLPMDFKAIWEAMEECQKLGLAKSIGVSNFSCKKLDQLLSTAKIPPAVNQVEMHPLWQQHKLRKFCAEKGVHVTAYAPLGAIGNPWGSNQVMECKVLNEIAAAKGKTVAQVSLRWVLEQGVSLVVKSFKEERMKQNLQVFDWGFTEEELHRIASLPQRKVYSGEDLISVNGPFKSVDELWDGEI